MKKIPTIFDRDWNGDRSRVLNKPYSDCGWVFAGEGVAKRKIDGTSCMVRGDKLFKRRELREGDTAPEGFEVADEDAETGKTVGWVPVGDGAEDKWHRFAFDPLLAFEDGTYELIGPKIHGNPEKSETHALVSHADPKLTIDPQPPRSFDELRAWMDGQDVEGIVWHHPDGRMAKLKLRDFGLKRKRQTPA